MSLFRFNCWSFSSNIPECFPSPNASMSIASTSPTHLSEVADVQPKTATHLLQRMIALKEDNLRLPVLALRIKEEKLNVFASHWADQITWSVALESNKVPVVATNLPFEFPLRLHTTYLCWRLSYSSTRVLEETDRFCARTILVNR